VPVKKVATVFNTIGNSFAYVCIATLLVITIHTFNKRRRKSQEAVVHSGYAKEA
jgi:hypothetical protein